MIPTIIICVILAGVVALAIASIIRDKKKGKCACGNSCSGCAMNGACHSSKEKNSK